MHTDIPLKVLTMERGEDLFPLLGVPPATTLLRVESLELPTVAKRLDTIMHLMSPDGHPHVHLVEWHGWNDPAVLWRNVWYAAWYGMEHPDVPITMTLIYLNPTSDRGTTIDYAIEQIRFQCTLHCIRLWTLPAASALATGLPGMAVLSPLMDGATEATVEQAAAIVRHTTSYPQQDDLLTILGILAEPLIHDPDRLMLLIGKEPFVESKLLDTLFEERYGQRIQEFQASKDKELQAFKEQEIAQIEQQAAQRIVDVETRYQEQLAAKEEELHVIINNLQATIEQSLVARFPHAPVSLLHTLRQCTTITQFNAIMHALITAHDLSDFEHKVQQMDERSQN